MIKLQWMFDFSWFAWVSKNRADSEVNFSNFQTKLTFWVSSWLENDTLNILYRRSSKLSTTKIASGNYGSNWMLSNSTSHLHLIIVWMELTRFVFQSLLKIICCVEFHRLEYKFKKSVSSLNLKCCISFVRHTLGMTDMLMQFWW